MSKSKKPTANRQPLTVPEILNAILSLHGVDKMVLFSALSDRPARTTPFVVMPFTMLSDGLREALSDLTPDTPEAERDAALLTLYEADPIKNNQRVLADNNDMTHPAVRKAIGRARKRRTANEEQWLRVLEVIPV